MIIHTRKANLSDADSLSQFIVKLDNESKFLLYDAGERQGNLDIVKLYLLRIENCGKSVVFIAENTDKEMVGFICGEVSPLKRVSHVMKVNIGALKNYHGLGIGRMLGKMLLQHVLNMDIKRVEVTVIKSNSISLNICKKFGFEVEGIKKHAIKIGTEFFDEYLLARIF
jgi:RimJ/RimL family protein N-acetyltransferase